MILFLSVAMLLAGCDKDNAPVAVSEVSETADMMSFSPGSTNT